MKIQANFFGSLRLYDLLKIAAFFRHLLVPKWWVFQMEMGTEGLSRCYWVSSLNDEKSKENYWVWGMVLKIQPRKKSPKKNEKKT